jgi:hypothetical protein
MRAMKDRWKTAVYREITEEDRATDAYKWYVDNWMGRVAVEAYCNLGRLRRDNPLLHHGLYELSFATGLMPNFVIRWGYGND